MTAINSIKKIKNHFSFQLNHLVNYFNLVIIHIYDTYSNVYNIWLLNKQLYIFIFIHTYTYVQMIICTSKFNIGEIKHVELFSARLSFSLVQFFQSRFLSNRTFAIVLKQILFRFNFLYIQGKLSEFEFSEERKTYDVKNGSFFSDI